MTTEEAEVIIGVLRVTIEQQAKEIEDCKRLLESNFKLIRTSHEAELKTKDKEIEELKTKLLYAEDAAAKGDLARQQCGGMEMEIEELKAERVAVSTALDREFCFPGDRRSSDLLDDLACFIDHHKAKEEQLQTLRTQNEMLKVGAKVNETNLLAQNERLVKALDNMRKWLGNPKREEWLNNAEFLAAKKVDEEAQALLAELKPRTEVTPHSSVDAIPEASGTSQLNQ